MKTEVNKQSDEFMAAFWAGYMLGKVNDGEQQRTQRRAGVR